jgi:hypothetical protein
VLHDFCLLISAPFPFASPSFTMSPVNGSTNGIHHANEASSAKRTSRPCTLLRVRGVDIVERASGEKVILKGAGLGGHLNMENFITGFSGHEHQHRAALLSALGPAKYKFFFDKPPHASKPAGFDCQCLVSMTCPVDRSIPGRRRSMTPFAVIHGPSPQSSS